MSEGGREGGREGEEKGKNEGGWEGGRKKGRDGGIQKGWGLEGTQTGVRGKKENCTLCLNTQKVILK